MDDVIIVQRLRARILNLGLCHFLNLSYFTPRVKWNVPQRVVPRINDLGQIKLLENNLAM